MGWRRQKSAQSEQKAKGRLGMSKAIQPPVKILNTSQTLSVPTTPPPTQTWQTMWPETKLECFYRRSAVWGLDRNVDHSLHPSRAAIPEVNRWTIAFIEQENKPNSEKEIESKWECERETEAVSLLGCLSVKIDKIEQEPLLSFSLQY